MLRASNLPNVRELDDCHLDAALHLGMGEETEARRPGWPMVLATYSPEFKLKPNAAIRRTSEGQAMRAKRSQASRETCKAMGLDT